VPAAHDGRDPPGGGEGMPPDRRSAPRGARGRTHRTRRSNDGRPGHEERSVAQRGTGWTTIAAMTPATARPVAMEDGAFGGGHAKPTFPCVRWGHPDDLAIASPPPRRGVTCKVDG
jgi:hypothetical protein